MEGYNEGNDNNNVDSNDSSSNQSSDTGENTGNTSDTNDNSSSSSDTDDGSDFEENTSGDEVDSSEGLTDTDDDDEFEENTSGGEVDSSDGLTDTDDEDEFEENTSGDEVGGTDDSSDTNDDDEFEENSENPKTLDEDDIKDRMDRLDEKLAAKEQATQQDASENPTDSQDSDGDDTPKRPITPPAGTDANPSTDMGTSRSTQHGMAEGNEDDSQRNDQIDYGNAGADPYASYPETHFVPTSDQYQVEESEQTAYTNGRAQRELQEYQQLQDKKQDDDDEAIQKMKNEEKIAELRKKLADRQNKMTEGDEEGKRPLTNTPHPSRWDGNER